MYCFDKRMIVWNIVWSLEYQMSDFQLIQRYYNFSKLYTCCDICLWNNYLNSNRVNFKRLINNKP